ncbi:MAG: inositol monophosphatase [Gammaproteobacteria bacterium]|nr:inositol monophosphatase [Gammaproteobacteria bacterium]NNF61645.1 inositol monophosphatase [Gammaproteobacteria bacterium]NNM20549.1 inositol monophosphatase [Gammaproteobacteria bacterium]
MHPLVNIAVSAARRAGEVIIKHVNFVHQLTVTEKSQNDFVSEVDRMAEAEIIGTIRESYPDHAFLGEESGPSGESESVWIIDPLDGTTNFLHGFPMYSVSIGFQHKGRMEQAVIYNPISQELFTASRGRGAQLDGRKIRVSNRRGLQGALIGTGFPYRANKQFMREYMRMFRAMAEKTAGIRRCGSAALDLAYVAAGRLDGFWELGLGPWDMAAGSLIIREAGGLVADLDGEDTFLDSGNIIAASPKVFTAILAELRPHIPSQRTTRGQ